MIDVITDKDILRTKCTLSDDPQKTLGILKDNFDTRKYLGLAAIQLGINDRVAIVYDKDVNDFIDIIDWQIVNKDLPIEFEEGCLSLPGKIYRVPRYRQITIKDQKGNLTAWYYGDSAEEIEKAKGQAQCEIPDIKVIALQQEIDHMDGILLEDIAVGERTYAVTIKNIIKVGRNEPCPCGSGKKYKKCCGRNN